MAFCMGDMNFSVSVILGLYGHFGVSYCNSVALKLTIFRCSKVQQPMRMVT